MSTFSGGLYSIVGYMPGNPAYADAPPVGSPPGLLARAVSAADNVDGPAGFGTGVAAGWVNTINDYFMEQIHLRPQVMDFGPVFGPKVLTMLLLNTFRAEPRTLSAVDLSALGAGMALTSGAVPQFFEFFEDLTLQFTATPDGDSSFDDFAIFDFDYRDIPVRFLGTRLVPFTLEANMEASILHSVGYVTDILVAKRGDEQRIQLKDIPRIALEFTITALEERDAELLQVLLTGWQWRVFGVPLWQDGQPLANALAPGATQIDLATTAGYDFEVGGIVFIWQDAHTWEAVAISAINPTSLTTTSIAGSWAAHSTLILPMKLGRLTPDEVLEWLSVDINNARLRFSMEASE